MVDRGNFDVSVVKGKCELLSISRSSVYYRPAEASEYELELSSVSSVPALFSCGHRIPFTGEITCEKITASCDACRFVIFYTI